MSADDESPEGGEFHEINGRRYSVVGNKVYVNGFFGWELVEDEDEQAAAGDLREVNGHTYSLIGDTLYCKNWLGGWDEVTDTDEKAAAGDLHEVRGSTYSTVGSTVYRKTLFGWEEVTDGDELADAGDIREVGNSTYAIVGDEVYRKDLFGWSLVGDEDECAEAGDHEVRHNTTYSRVGDTVYKKELFGWTKISSEPEQQTTHSFSPPAKHYSSSSEDSGTTDDSGAWWIKWLFYIALFIGAVWLAFAVVLPLVIINAAILCLIAAFIRPGYKKVFLAVAALGTVYIALDAVYGWVTSRLVENVTFFAGSIPYFVYGNIAAGLVGAYLLIRDRLDEKRPPVNRTNEFSQRNLIVMASVIMAGALVIWFVSKSSRIGKGTHIAPAGNYTNNTPAAQSPAAVDAAVAAMDSGKMIDTAVAARDAAKRDSLAAIFVADTAQMKASLAGHPIPGNDLSSPDAITSFYIKSRRDTLNGVNFDVVLQFPGNTEAEIQMEYTNAPGHWELGKVQEIYITMEVAIPADRWVQFCPVPGCSWNTRDDSKLSWKTADDAQEIQTGSDMGNVTLPNAACYLLRSREEGPLMMRFYCRPVN